MSSDHSDDAEEVKKVGREVSVSYDYIGEDSYLISPSGKETSGGQEGEMAHSDDEAEKYSKITTSVGVKILEGDCGELRHLVSVPPSSNGTAAVDVSSLYAKVNKQKKSMSSEASEGKEGDSGYREVQSSHSPDHKGNSTIELLPAERGTAGNAGTGEISQSMEGIWDLPCMKEPHKSLTTAESLVSIEMLVTDMCNSLKDEEDGAGTTRGSGTIGTLDGDVEGENREEVSKDGANELHTHSGGTEGDTQKVDDDCFYVNIDL